MQRTGLNTRLYIKDDSCLCYQVIIVGHHPPGDVVSIVQHSRQLTDLSVEYSDVIVLHMSGHTHNDEFRLVSIRELYI